MRCSINFYIVLLYAFYHVYAQESNEKPGKGELSLVIKDDGIVELHKGDVAMLLYITVTNTGTDSLHLSINVTKCCQKWESSSEEEEDCESMKPFGGDAGELYPQDTRNLTAIYPTLYLHDHKGNCEIDITSEDGRKISRTLKFDTSLVTESGVRVPRLLEEYYDPKDIMKCSSTDQDPLNECRPASCIIKYSGYRNFYNHSTQRCDKLPSCISKSKDVVDTAYVPELNACYEMKEKLTEEELAQFKEGKPSIHTLVHAHKYPMNIRCHHGTVSEDKESCECKKGWASAPFDPASFNFDVQEYHMCTVWTGDINAKEAANVTIVSKKKHGHTTAIIFSVLVSLFAIVAIILAVTYFMQKRPKLPPEALILEESVKLMELQDDLSEETTSEIE